MESHPIYLDYHATTPVDIRVAQCMHHYMVTEFGNASSVDHAWGDRADMAVKQAAQDVSALIGASPRDIIWTSGATESINLAIQGTVNQLEKLGVVPHIAITTVEHKAVLDTCKALQSLGQIELTMISVDSKARINLDSLEAVCSQGIHLLCVMAANNEVGTIYPIQTIAAIAQRHSVPYLCDASQAVGKIPIRCKDWGITMLALSAHKFYGPKGVGALVVQRGHRLASMMYGGGHQRGFRSGTLNVPGIVGLGEACRLRSQEMYGDEHVIAANRNRLQTLLQQTISHLAIHGDLENRLSGNLHIAVPGAPNSAVIARLRNHLAISTGSACSSGVETPSHVLRAMKLEDDIIDASLRISIGKFISNRDIESSAYLLKNAIISVQSMIRS